MPPTIATSPKSFIASLTIPRSFGPLAATDAAPSASVDAGSTVSFVAGVPKQTQEDCLNSTLLAYLAANFQFNRFNDIQNWYSFYQDVLTNIGWDPQQFDFTQFTTSGDSFTVDQAILQLIQSIGTADELQVITATINALKSLARTDDRLVLWESNTHTDRAGNFQVNAVKMSDGIPVMSFTAYNFQASQTVDQLLFFSFSNSTDTMFQSGQSMSLDLDVYSQVRQAIKQKLGANAVNFVKDIQI
jgi:hypothetical protein